MYVFLCVCLLRVYVCCAALMWNVFSKRLSLFLVNSLEDNSFVHFYDQSGRHILFYINMTRYYTFFKEGKIQFGHFLR